MAIKLEELALVLFRLEYQKIAADLAESENFVSVQGQEIDNLIRQKDEEVKVFFLCLPA